MRRVVIVYVLVALAVVAAAAVLLAGGGPELPEDPAPGRPLDWPADGRATAGDLDRVRFGVTLRGYRMDQVDRVLDDMRRTLAEQERQLVELRAGTDAPAGDAPLRAVTDDSTVTEGGEPR